MSKLRLDLDRLVVESFATDGAGGEAGTVHGHDDSVIYPGGTIGRRSEDPRDCSQATCGNLYSCWVAMYTGCCTNDADYTCESEVINCIPDDQKTQLPD